MTKAGFTGGRTLLLNKTSDSIDAIDAIDDAKRRRRIQAGDIYNLYTRVITALFPGAIRTWGR